MPDALLHAAWMSGLFVLLFGLTEWLYHRRGVPSETTRKLTHIVVGLTTLLFPLLLHRWVVLAMCAGFALLLIVTLRRGWLPSINRVGRRTFGSFLFPAIVFVCFVLQEERGNRLWFYLPILLLTLCDPLAAAVGRRWPLGRYALWGGQKTLSGSGAFFLAALGISAWLLGSFAGLQGGALWGSALLIALATTLAEGLSSSGLDNLSIPLAALALLYVLAL